jgi:hypothetical protein
MRLIGLVGRSRVGKDTVAAMVFGQTHELRRLAQPVKDACKALYGWSDEHVESALKEETDPRWGVTPRLAMVHMTNSLRSFMGADFFTRRFFETLEVSEGPEGPCVVVPDVRYQEDIREIHKRGGITIKITRPGMPQHVFESGVDDLETTWVVSNDGTVEELCGKIDSLWPKATSCARRAHSHT